MVEVMSQRATAELIGATSPREIVRQGMIGIVPICAAISLKATRRNLSLSRISG